MFHLIGKIKAKIEGLFREISFSFFKCFPKSNGHPAAFFFDDEKRMNVFKKLQYIWSVNLPNVLLFPMWFRFSTWSIQFVNCSSKIFIKPIHKTFICCRNIHSEIKLSSFFRINFTFPEHDASFPVDNSCEISQFFTLIHGTYNVR